MGLLEMTPEELERLQRSLGDLNDALGDLNSAFPETQKFLQARGLNHIRELDKSGLVELRRHLETVLRSICQAKA